MLSDPGGRGARKRGEGNFSSLPRPGSLSTAHPSDDDAPHRWERSSAEERDEWWHAEWGVGEDW